MAKTNVRQKSKASLKNRRSIITIKVEDLRIGDQLARGVLQYPVTGEIVATKGIQVKEVTECPGMWRTHIHVNKSECYDTRHTIEICGAEVSE